MTAASSEAAATTPGLVPASTALSRPADHPWANDKTGWVHEDDTPCPEYIAPDNGTRWWCTEHEKYLKPPAEAAATAPGRAAYEAFMHSVTSRNPDVPVVVWERLDDLVADGYTSSDTRADWEAAAQAASQEQYLHLRSEIDRLTRERDSLTAELADWKARYRDLMAEANQLRSGGGRDAGA